ncbi:MAG: hypothetical protein AMJ70_00395 [Dehalococcoidia bacterium SG8_51_3]|nr:MAG: hypothetical protein AMJ70_00395 [Dehalococcoidia bacterium SG8_51_3]
MVDKSLYIFLIITFGVGALVILLISWLTPAPPFERLINTLIAVIGVTMVCMMRRFITTS